MKETFRTAFQVPQAVAAGAKFKPRLTSTDVLLGNKVVVCRFKIGSLSKKPQGVRTETINSGGGFSFLPERG